MSGEDRAPAPGRPAAAGDPSSPSEPPKRAALGIGVGIAIGAGIGAALSAATGESMWLPVGIGIGVALGAGIGAAGRR